MTTRSITKPVAEPQAAAAAIKQLGPSAPAAQARTLWHADGLRARLRGIGERERRGYGVWLFAGLVFGVPESWAGITSPPWPALSDTVGHLEQLWHPVKVIVVTLIVFVVFRAVRCRASRRRRRRRDPSRPYCSADLRSSRSDMVARGWPQA